MKFPAPISRMQMPWLSRFISDVVIVPSYRLYEIRGGKTACLASDFAVGRLGRPRDHLSNSEAE
jgi:hypothetical protein